MEESLHPLRIFYRCHLARYGWARWLKSVFLLYWFFWLHFRHVITWRVQHTGHVIKIAVSRNLHVVSLAAARLAHRLNEKSTYQTRAATHWLAYWVVRVIGNFGGGAARLAQWMQVTQGTRVAFFSMVSLPEYVKTNKPSTCLLSSAKTFPLPVPAVYPEEYRKKLYSKVWPLDIPSVEAIEIPNADIVGKCDFIFSGLKCLHHGLYRFERDQPPEEMHGMIGINLKKELVARYQGSHEQMEPLPAAISMIGSASGNYVHWLTETAPKLAFIDQSESYEGLPLIIDADLHPNILESIRYLNSRQRELIPIKRGQVCRVHKLVAISTVAYVPFDFRGAEKCVPEIHPGLAMYVPDGLNLLREKLVSRFGTEGSLNRLYLRRSAKSRQMSNSADVEALLQAHGFLIVEPETLSFAEQVRLFSSAEMIVGQGGAAFGNIIFAPKGCQIVILTTWSPFTIYYYFSNLASMLEQSCSFVLCDPVEDPDGFHVAHKGLTVDIPHLKKAIDL